ncbi:NIPSNAP family protein [Bacillus wiedmannii]|uniref:NIPSNAP family protein n=1 Tax=Bacillus wiedmannii TaxID=1890302 RepID=UPI0002DF7075|nr:NIPSNAP family protein [Bacillus wiedmannii]MCC2377631.1 NIPSNAP family protein [Bacillus wiedmannii]MCC2422145.1 NIPSNAP family protein [Bacillus wiedmannii]
MFYRRKYYIVKNEFIKIFNEHFNNTNLPNQLKHGSRLIGRSMKDNKNDTTEVFAIWEYDSYEQYKEIESKIRSDKMHVTRIQDWYEKHGGKEYVLQKYIVELKNEELVCTVK